MPAWVKFGAQVSVPVGSAGPGVRTASLPAGSPETFAVSDVMGSPSMSAACTRTVTLLASATEAAAGAAMVGARSVLATTMVALEEPDSALPAVKVTVYEPALL